MTDREYNDDYATCSQTRISFVVYLPTGGSAAELQLGSGFERSTRGAPRWSLTSEGRIWSRDIRRHLDWVLDWAERERVTLRAMAAAGCDLKTWVYWVSESGHGGPTVEVKQMARLAALGARLEFDVYFYDREEDAEEGYLRYQLEPFLTNWETFAGSLFEGSWKGDDAMFASLVDVRRILSERSALLNESMSIRLSEADETFRRATAARDRSGAESEWWFRQLASRSNG